MKGLVEQRPGSALVLVDLQNSFLHERGQNHYPGSANILPAIRELLKIARQAGTPVIFVAERHRPGVDDFETAKLPAHCIDGDFDSLLYSGFGPVGDSEFLLAKRRMSAFQGTDLDLLLRELNVRSLVIGGVKTNVCVRATVQDGFALGYRCHVVREAVNSNRQHLSDASLEDIDRYMGWVVTLDEASGLLS